MRTIKKRSRFVFIAVMIFSLIAMYGYTPIVEAANLTHLVDTISDSDLGATSVTHTIEYTISQALVATDYTEVDIPAGFVNVLVGGVTCADSASTTPTVSGDSGSGWVIKCTANEAIATGTKTMTIAGTQNPSVQGDYSIIVSTKTSGDVVKEDSDTKVYILSSVSVSATVNAVLSFSIGTTTPQDMVGNDTYTGTSSPTAIAFGEIVNGQNYIMGHQLTVVTNANDGYTVTVEQDQNLKTAADADIDPFSTSTPADWADPTGDYTNETTWGHWGVTTDDTTGTAFAANKYEGLWLTNPLTVMTHNGPVNGAVTGVGTTKVGYKLRISPLQEAGDYQNSLTYICTPTF